MARRKREQKRIGGFFSDLQAETRHGVFSVIFLAIGFFFLFASFGKAGIAGKFVYEILESFVGVGFFLFPVVSFFLSVSLFLSSEKPSMATRVTIGSIILFVAGLGLVEMISRGAGGTLGVLFSQSLESLFDTTVTAIIFGVGLAISLLLIFDAVPRLETIFSRKNKESVNTDNEDEKRAVAAAIAKNEAVSEPTAATAIRPEETEEKDAEEPEKKNALFNMRGVKVGAPLSQKKQYDVIAPPFVPPPLSLLERDRGKPGVGDIKANAAIIKRSLQNFGIHVEMDEISIGPSVTRYAFKPAEGVKLSRIVGLQNDLSLALAAHPLRIEAPIPGKSLVGIEIPNTSRITVGLASLLSAQSYTERSDPLAFPIGKDISGHVHVGNLARMPHLLIAGSTGSGKSVMIHTLITSLFYRNAPDYVKFIMIDPKRVELTAYNNTPNLLTPVITNAKKAILALKWVAKEMDRRYDVLEAETVRDISSYHKNVYAPARAEYEKIKDAEGAELPESMPYIVIIIDELADIMMSYPRELESAIVRLAQMARAVGIHLILSTQRPSVQVITGLIKANIPARIAFQVSSQIDSRTILDAGGAEKLLGAGDMLYMSGDMAKPRRLQSAFISEQEVKSVVKYLRKNYSNTEHSDEDALSLGLTSDSSSNEERFSHPNFDEVEEGEDDELYEEAREIVVGAGKAATSYLQRKLKVGYARAARLMDVLEERGVIGPPDGAKPREVLIKQETDINESPANEESKETDASMETYEKI